MVLDGFALTGVALKVMLYITSLAASGLLLFRLIFARDEAELAAWLRRRLLLLASLGLGVAAARFLVAGARLTGVLSGMTDTVMLGILWSGPVGTALILQLAGFALIAAGAIDWSWSKWIGLVGVALLITSFGQVGHVLQLDADWGLLLLLVHLVGLAFWIGSLAPLYRATRRQDLAAAATLAHGFGQVAIVIVPVLLVAGAVCAALLLRDLGALFGTTYGQVLLIKIVLVGAILTLAALNKYRFVPAMQAGDTLAAVHLQRSILIEAAFIGLVLIATSILTSVLSLPE